MKTSENSDTMRQIISRRTKYNQRLPWKIIVFQCQQSKRLSLQKHQSCWTIFESLRLNDWKHRSYDGFTQKNRHFPVKNHERSPPLQASLVVGSGLLYKCSIDLIGLLHTIQSKEPGVPPLTDSVDAMFLALKNVHPVVNKKNTLQKHQGTRLPHGLHSLGSWRSINM